MGKSKKKKKSSFFRKVLISILFIVAFGLGLTTIVAYRAIYQPNVALHGKKSQYVYIHTGWDFQDVLNMLCNENIISNRATFQWLARIKHYPDHVNPGRYRVTASMSNNKLINMLRSGKQAPVRLTFNNVRTKAELVEKVTAKIEADSVSLMKLLNDNDYLKQYGLNKDNALTLFIPNTYQFYWNTSAKELMERMAREYKDFWNAARRAKAKTIGLTPVQVSILASIVQAEQSRFNDEKPIIAGLYINRLKKGIPLQSDPTLIYAKGDFSITRVLDVDKKVDSPYNTYMHAGLPPGPICLPEISSLKAVLNYYKSNYLYMCAKPDLSGRHNFAATEKQHERNAKAFRQALNARGIMR